MPSINTSDITRASDSTYFVDIARVNKLIYLLTYLTSDLPKIRQQSQRQIYVKFQKYSLTFSRRPIVSAADLPQIRRRLTIGGGTGGSEGSADPPHFKTGGHKC